MRKTTFSPLLPGPLCAGVVEPDRALSMGQIELTCVLILNWIVWNRTVLPFNCDWTKTILIVNWIVWSVTVGLNWITWNKNVYDH